MAKGLMTETVGVLLIALFFVVFMLSKIPVIGNIGILSTIGQLGILLPIGLLLLLIARNPLLALIIFVGSCVFLLSMGVSLV